jgi:hypothetical protein
VAKGLLDTSSGEIISEEMAGPAESIASGSGDDEISIGSVSADRFSLAERLASAMVPVVCTERDEVGGEPMVLSNSM